MHLWLSNLHGPESSNLFFIVIPLLSIIVISHNQCEQLRRCLDSILAMQLSFAHEIIVSDDGSTDGSREMLEKEYGDKVRITYCNSDECDPAMTSERAGYNRINGLKNAQGKYIIHVDGDDFYTSNDIFQIMVNTLESHPECNLCFQNYRVLEEGKSLEDSSLGCDSNSFVGNPIISAENFVQKFPYIHNSACCARKSALQSIDALTGATYDDVDITYQYIGKKNVALVNRSDFVHVHYKSGTASRFAAVDQQVQWASALYVINIAPQLTGVLLKYNLDQIHEVARLGRKKVKLSKRTLNYLEKFDIAILNSFDNEYGSASMMRINLVWWWIKLIKRFHWEKPIVYRILYRLSIKWDIDKQVCFDYNSR